MAASCVSFMARAAAPTATPVRVAVLPLWIPENGISFAYTMNQMGIGALPGERAMGLVWCLYGG